MRKKVIAYSAIALALAGTAFAGKMVAKAADDTGNNGIVETIANKFNLNKDDVQKVLDETREQHQQQRQEEREASLDKAVSDGVITSEQKDALVKKQAEIQAAHEKERTEMEQWMKDNGIDESKLSAYGIGPGGPGHGYGHGKN